ncbi:unnamed protein product [Adineta ricciae]|uniref:NHL repeat containing protein n=1 Tax=Adineta ricciae TaxID=249248 RepID=A0A815LC99_ADIRI|nr:unnamed protein product [Adineta ricciae]
MKTNSVSVLENVPDQSQNAKNHQHLKTTRTPKTVIYTTIKSSRYKQFTSSQNNSRSLTADDAHRYQKSSIDFRQKNNNSPVSSSQDSRDVVWNLQNKNSETKFIRNDGSHTPSTEAMVTISWKSSEIKNTWENPVDYHCKRFHPNLNERKKKKYRRLCVISLIIFLLALIVATIIVLSVLLTKSKTKTNVAVPVLRWNTTGITIAGITGWSGINESQLNHPWGLALTYDRTLYVADRFNSRIQKFLSGSTKATTVVGNPNGVPNTTLNSLYYPSKIALDANENLYIADGYNNRTLFWGKNSNSGVIIGGSGIAGNALNELTFPFDIARDPDLDITYVLDYGNNRIMGYKPGNSTGFIVAGGNGSGSGFTQLDHPMAMHFDSVTNSLIIAIFNRHNIVRWPLGANNWTLVAGDINGLSGSTSTSLQLPTGLTLDPMGNLYVADLGNHRIQLFLNGEMNGTTIAGITGQPGNDSLSLYYPYTIVLDNQLNLYVADNANHRIQKFLRY